jgi:hypothetical protein
MSRPAHIAPLDAALEEQVARLSEVEAEIAAFHDLYYDVLEKHDALITERANVYGGVKLIESSIRKLGYVVYDGKGGILPANSSRLDGQSYSTVHDRAAAKDRRELRARPMSSSVEDINKEEGAS